MISNLSKTYTFIVIALFFVILAIPSFLLAQQNVAPTEYQLLAPIPQIESSPGVTNTATYIPGLIKLIIAIATGLAVLMIIFGGIKYMTSDAFQGKSDAKKTIMDAIWGLLLVIGAWTILYTINPKLLNFDLSISQQGSDASINNVNITGPNTGDYSADNQIPGPSNFGGLTQQQARDQLLAAGVTTQGPILLEGVHQNVINEVIGLKTSCSCDVVVNSATGGQHNDGTYSHANGYKVDLNDTTSLTNYITQNFTPTVTRGDGARQWISPTGVIYARESTHWDIVVK